MVVSGLAMNVGKTEVIIIGASRARRLTWEGQFGLKWTSTFEVLGIVFDTKDIDNITDLNMKHEINDMTKIIRTWGARSLTLYGKVTVIKSLVLSKITHLLLALPCPSDEISNKYNTSV